jgi:hypothetical protein
MTTNSGVTRVRRWRCTLTAEASFSLFSRTRSQILWYRAPAATMVIHDTPKRSATRPKRGEKKVFVKDTSTFPPSATETNNRSASTSVSVVSDSEKPSKLSLPLLAGVVMFFWLEARSCFMFTTTEMERSGHLSAVCRQLIQLVSNAVRNDIS